MFLSNPVSSCLTFRDKLNSPVSSCIFIIFGAWIYHSLILTKKCEEISMQPVALTSDESISLAFDPPLAIWTTGPDYRLRKVGESILDLLAGVIYVRFPLAVHRSRPRVDQGTAPFDCEENEDAFFSLLFLPFLLLPLSVYQAMSLFCQHSWQCQRWVLCEVVLS